MSYAKKIGRGERMSQAGELDVLGNHPEIATLFVEDIGFAIPSAHTINIIGGTGITTTGSGNTITIDATGSGFAWVSVTSADNPVTLIHNTGYFAKGAGVVDFILPASASEGDTFWIKGIANLWTVAQNAGQKISLGMVSSTVGVGGSITATQVKDGIEIICSIANTDFEILDSIGNPSFI